ncbi:MAG: UDP-N-acetylmuramoyl-tripeptide--D-alanyl-D-alanine ligase [Actinobacteria bacterium]|nr:MAG: UDP-N-acetylmuramoyl-tripeptide--D-alanyl-D-alanine ligase [Actinomycetota bacterium]
MKPRPLASVAAAVGGERAGDDVDISSVTTDSRQASPGALFVALAGERTDGHRFVQDAVARGAAAVLVRQGADAPAPKVQVASPADALSRLAADERRRFDGTVVAVAGANGKTSTKDMTGAVVSTRFRVHASPGSFNNEIGLPLTLLGAPPDAEVIVAELGARRAGDVAVLMPIARPDIIVVTNVGVAHMEIFGSWDVIVRASAEPVEAMDEAGVLVLNADDPVVAGFASRASARVLTFGRAPSANVRAEGVGMRPDGRPTFDLVAGGGRERVTLTVAGEHMVSNALAAAAVNDAYNANPESMAAALKAATVMAADRRVVAVLGQMAELGDIGPAEHERVGELAARLGVDRLITVGTEAKSIAVAGLREGFEPDAVANYDDIETALQDVRAHIRRGDLVLVKGSRVAGLETLAEALR